MRHLVTHIERPAAARRAEGADGADDAIIAPPSDEEPVPDGEFIDESESEAAPAAID